MPTDNPRINVTLEPEYAGLIAMLAERDHISVSAKAKQLMLAALELEEDIYYSTLAEKREKQTKKWVSHKDAWK